MFYIVGECISCAADTHLATDLTCKKPDYPETIKQDFKGNFEVYVKNFLVGNAGVLMSFSASGLKQIDCDSVRLFICGSCWIKTEEKKDF